MSTTNFSNEGHATALPAGSGLEPFQVTRKQLHQIFNSQQLVKQMVAAGWIVPVRPGKQGRESLFDYQSAKSAFARLRAGEAPKSMVNPVNNQLQEAK